MTGSAPGPAPVVSPDELRGYDGVATFSATMPADRERLGDRVTDWLRAHPKHAVATAVVTQSSDERFHCITMTLFWRADVAP